MGSRKLIVDTHVAIWIDEERELSQEARRGISRAAARGLLYISAISAWEVATLIRLQRLRITKTIEDYVNNLFNLPGVREAPVTAEIARVAGEFPESLHGDPIDRIIIATASVLGVPLVTRDRRILKFAKTYGGFSCVEA